MLELQKKGEKDTSAPSFGFQNAPFGPRRRREEEKGEERRAEGDATHRLRAFALSLSRGNGGHRGRKGRGLYRQRAHHHARDGGSGSTIMRAQRRRRRRVDG